MQSMKRFPLLCLVFVLCLCVAPAWSATLSFVPQGAEIEFGQSLDIDLWITDLEQGVDLGAFDFTVQYDPAILVFNKYLLGTGLGPDSDWDYWDLSLGPDGFGSVNLAAFSWLSDLSFQEDSFLLATLTFTGAMAGNSELSFANILLGDAGGDDLEAASEIGHVKVNSAAASPVPEPCTILLFGLGLAIVVSWQRRK